MFEPNILVPDYHQEKISDIYRDTMMQIISLLLFIEKGSRPCLHTVQSYTEYTNDQLKQLNLHLNHLKKLKVIPDISDKHVQNFSGIINRFLQIIKFHHERN